MLGKCTEPSGTRSEGAAAEEDGEEHQEAQSWVGRGSSGGASEKKEPGSEGEVPRGGDADAGAKGGDVPHDAHDTGRIFAADDPFQVRPCSR